MGEKTHGSERVFDQDESNRRMALEKILEKLCKGTDEGRMLEDDDGNEDQLREDNASETNGDDASRKKSWKKS